MATIKQNQDRFKDLKLKSNSTTTRGGGASAGGGGGRGGAWNCGCYSSSLLMFLFFSFFFIFIYLFFFHFFFLAEAKSSWISNPQRSCRDPLGFLAIPVLRLDLCVRFKGCFGILKGFFLAHSKRSWQLFGIPVLKWDLLGCFKRSLSHSPPQIQWTQWKSWNWIHVSVSRDLLGSSRTFWAHFKRPFKFFEILQPFAHSNWIHLNFSTISMDLLGSSCTFWTHFKRSFKLFGIPVLKMHPFIHCQGFLRMLKPGRGFLY